MRSSFMFCALILIPVATMAEVVHTPVLGDIVLGSASYDCPQGTCQPCVNDVDFPGDTRLMLAFGTTGPTLDAWGTISGTVAPFVEIDGVQLFPSLLPTGSFFRAGLVWHDFLVPGSCPNGPPGLTYEVAPSSSATVNGDGSVDIDVPAEAATAAVPFSFRFCNEFVYWGAGCDVAGSSTHRWALHLPAPLHAFEVGPGSAAPIVVAGQDIALTFQEGPGGVFTSTKVDAPAPVGAPLTGPASHWDLRTDMAPGSFTAELTVSFDLLVLPPEVNPAELVLVRFDEALEVWQSLDTILDLSAGTATATTDRFSIFALTTEVPVATASRSWGSIKARF